MVRGTRCAVVDGARCTDGDAGTPPGVTAYRVPRTLPP